jgi:ATP-dependent RNA helicase DeaD
MEFSEISINKKIIDKLNSIGFKNMTEIQEKCLPEIINGRDVVGQAETGSGKTLAFCIPILDKININKKIQALILTPTRELCIQVSEVFYDFGNILGVNIASIYGGVGIEPQIDNISKSEIVVGTPGRLLDHIRRGTLDLGNIDFLVIDEIDKMFEMGFIDDVKKIINKTPNNRQTLMFSATIFNKINNLMRKHLKDPLLLSTKSYVDKNKLEQIYYDIYNQKNKFSLLLHLINNNKSDLSIVFCGTRVEAELVSKNLRQHKINASAIHGGMTQKRRIQSLNSLRDNKTDVLVATDVAARGLDIKNVTHIYHYDVPKTSTDYIHRIGRTARAGKSGTTITLLTERDHDNFRRVQSNDDLEITKAVYPEFKKVSFKRKKNYKKNQLRYKKSY